MNFQVFGQFLSLSRQLSPTKVTYFSTNTAVMHMYCAVVLFFFSTSDNLLMPLFRLSLWTTSSPFSVFTISSAKNRKYRTLKPMALIPGEASRQSHSEFERQEGKIIRPKANLMSYKCYRTHSPLTETNPFDKFVSPQVPNAVFTILNQQAAKFSNSGPQTAVLNGS